MQTLALLVDSWRLLASRKLFWLTLAINLLVVALYGSLAITENGVSLLYGLLPIESERFRAGSMLVQSVLIPFINVQVISFWLAWAATGLGIISTASIYPDFLADGAIDMVLAKPITRLKVFVVKYVGALLFVLVQVSVFAVASLLIGRLRFGDWQWMLLAAIPLVVVFFSYLYAMSVLVGVATRSSIAAILAAAVFWFAIFLVQMGEKGLHSYSTFADTVVETRAEVVAKGERELAALTAEGRDRSDNKFERVRGRLEANRVQLAKEEATAATANAWHKGLYITTMIVPKTSATIDLLDRWFARESGVSSLEELLAGDDLRHPRGPHMRVEEDEDMPEDLGRQSNLRLNAEIANRPVWWVIGTSLLFEIAVLGIAAVIFVRRDF